MIRDRQGSPASAKTVACFCPFWTSLSAVQRSPRQAMCGVFWSRSVPYQIREEKRKADLFCGVVHTGSGALISFPRWLVRDGGGHEHPLALLSRRDLLTCISGLSCATEKCRGFCRFRSLDGLRVTDGNLSINLRCGASSERKRMHTTALAECHRELTSVATRCRTA